MKSTRIATNTRNSGGWLINALALYWLLFILLDFARNSPDYIYALNFFKYTDYLLLSFVLCIGFLFPFIKKPLNLSNISIVNFRFIYFYPLLLILMILFSLFFQAKNGNEGSVFGLLTNSIIIHSSVVFILLAAYSTGAAILSRLSKHNFGGIRSFIALGLGFVVKGVLLFFLGATGNYSFIPVTVLLVLMLIPGWKEVFLLFKNNLLKKCSSVMLNPLSLVLIFSALIITTLNFIKITTPFPLGYDSLTLYLNLPLLISNSGELIQGQMPYYWSLIMGLGYVVFDSNPVVQYLGVMGGLLSMFLVISWSRRFFSLDWAIFSGVLFYLIPLVIWQSSVEIKTDLGKLFFALLAVVIVLGYYYSKFDRIEKDGLRSNDLMKGEILIWGLAGVLTAFALGIKFTAIMVAIALIAVLFYYRSGKFIAMSWSFAAIGFLLIAELYRFAGLQISGNEKLIFFAALALAALILFFLSVKNKERLFHLFKPVAIYFFFILLLLLPWTGKNLMEHGDFSFSNLIEGKDPTPAWFSYYESGEIYLEDPIPIFIVHDFFEEDPQFPVKMVNFEESTEVFQESSRYEEIGRYLGYEGGAMRFLSLPYDISMKKNVDLLSIDPGILFILFIPLLLFSGINRKPKTWVPGFILFLLWISLSIWSVYNPDNTGGLSDVVNKLAVDAAASGPGIMASIKQLHMLLIYPLLVIGSLMSPVYVLLSSGSDAISLAIVLISTIPVYFMFKNLLGNIDFWSRGWLLFSVLYFIIWLILSSGIPWYGIVGLSLLPFFLVKTFFLHKSSIYNQLNLFKYISLSVVYVWIFLVVSLKLSPLSTGKTPEPQNIDYAAVFLKPSMDYASRAIDDDEFFVRVFNEETKRIRNKLNEDKSKFILNVATMMRFFIEENHKRVFDDNQLDLFAKIWENSGQSKIVTANRLKNIGVDYILLDLNVHTLDRTPDGSLMHKVEEFVSFLHNNPHIELIETDRLVEHPRGDRQMEFNGRNIRVKNDIFGTQIIENGKLALFSLR